MSQRVIDEVVRHATAIYTTYEGCTGCCLHITLEDNNISDDEIAFCLEEAKASNHPDCIAAAEGLLLLSEAERRKIVTEYAYRSP